MTYGTVSSEYMDYPVFTSSKNKQQHQQKTQGNKTQMQTTVHAN